jgi:hypothetical protein
MLSIYVLLIYVRGSDVFGLEKLFACT